MRRRVACLVVLLAFGAACHHPVSSDPPEISRERAVEIARAVIAFTPDATEAIRESSNGAPVWRVTFRGRLPGQPPGLFETAVVDVHRQTGAIVSIAKT